MCTNSISVNAARAVVGGCKKITIICKDTYAGGISFIFQMRIREDGNRIAGLGAENSRINFFISMGYFSNSFGCIRICSNYYFTVGSNIMTEILMVWQP